MGAFVAQIAEPSPRQMLALATGVNEALKGHTANTLHISVPAGASSVTVRDPRCRAGRLAILIPLDAAAAAADWYLSDMGYETMTFTFTAAPGACEFGCALIGDGNIDI